MDTDSDPERLADLGHHLATFPDPRDPRGLRHRLASILALAAAAGAAGAAGGPPSESGPLTSRNTC